MAALPINDIDRCIDVWDHFDREASGGERNSGRECQHDTKSWNPASQSYKHVAVANGSCLAIFNGLLNRYNSSHFQLFTTSNVLTLKKLLSYKFPFVYVQIINLQQQLGVSHFP